MLEACDRLTVHILVDNYVDILGKSQPHVRRLGLDFHFSPCGGVVQADGGFSLVVDVYRGERRKRVLVDGGFTGGIVLHNMGLLGIDPASCEEAYLSHGHPDHFTGLPTVLRAVGHPLPLLVHPDAFLPRFIVPGDGMTMDYINRELTVAALSEAGARVVQTTSPVQLGPGLISSGQIEREVDFEQDVPKGRYRIRSGVLEPDDILDDTALFCHVKDRGLFVIGVCGHSGIVNTIRHAQKVTGVERVFGVMGGFHLGHPGLPADKNDKTLEAMQELGISFLAPMHCCGLSFRTRAAQLMPDAYVQVGAATVLDF